VISSVAVQADLTRSAPQVLGGSLTIRQATPDDARAIHELITGHREEGRLLPRHLGEIAVHASRFVVAGDEGELVGCVDLAPLSRTVAEIRSLVVDEDARSAGIGRQLIDAAISSGSARLRTRRRFS